MGGIQTVPISILLVDDNTTFITSVMNFVEAQAHFEIVGVAHSDQQVLDQIAVLDPELVLLAQHLAEVNSNRLLATIKAGVNAPCVVMLLDTAPPRHQGIATPHEADGVVLKTSFQEDFLPVMQSIGGRPECYRSSIYLFHEELQWSNPELESGGEVYQPSGNLTLASDDTWRRHASGTARTDSQDSCCVRPSAGEPIRQAVANFLSSPFSPPDHYQLSPLSLAVCE